MAVKEYLLTGKALDATLAKHTNYHSAKESKDEARIATSGKDYTWWKHHGMHVLVGTVACWLKFSQDSGLRRLLLSTQQALLVETSPIDGSWGVAMNSSEFLRSASVQDFAVSSTATQTLNFDVGTLTITRPHSEANALGKSLMITRELLAAGGKDATPDDIPTLGDAIALAARKMQSMDVPFDYASAVERLGI